MPATSPTPILSLKNISKSFPGVKALQDVHLDLYPGEIHALMGENGAGKSTLLKVMFGAHAANEGSIELNGEPVQLRGPIDALHKGISMVHQELSLVPQLSAIQNIALGREKAFAGFIDWATARREGLAALARLDFTGNPEAPVSRLSVGQQQTVELARALAANAKIIILDPKESPRPITEGFQEAFANLYKDQITYVPKAVIKEVDPFNKKIVTSAGDFRFDHSILMAPHQAGDMAWKAGTIGRNAEGKPTGWAGVDPLFLNLKDDPDTYVIGDAVGVVSPQFNFYPKAGHVANAHGKIVARYIADRAAGRQPKADLPDNLCFMMVNLDPIEDIAVRFKYHINEQGIIIQDQYDDNFRSADMVQEDFGWAAKMYGDMFGA